MPDGDLTAIQEGMVAMHELFTSMVDAGFSEKHACGILGAMMAHSQVGSGDES